MFLGTEAPEVGERHTDFVVRLYSGARESLAQPLVDANLHGGADDFWGAWPGGRPEPFDPPQLRRISRRLSRL